MIWFPAKHPKETADESIHECFCTLLVFVYHCFDRIAGKGETANYKADHAIRILDLLAA